MTLVRPLVLAGASWRFAAPLLSAAEPPAEKRRRTGRSQLLPRRPPHLPAALPGLPPAGQAAGRLRHDRLRRPAQDRRPRSSPASSPASPTRASSSSRSQPRTARRRPCPRTPTRCRPPRSTLIKKWIAAGRQGRHARRPSATSSTPSTRRSTTCRRSSPSLDLFARRQAARRRRLPRSAAAQGRRLRPGRPAGRPVGAHPVAGLLARRQAAWPWPAARRAASAKCRSGTWPRRSSSCRVRHLRHPLRRQLVARRHQDRLRLRRQHAPGHRRRHRQADPLPGRPQRLGAGHGLLARTRRSSSRSAATAR